MVEENAERRLIAIESKIDKITDLITKIAVQKNRIDTLTMQVEALWKKQDTLQLKQASCPKEQIKWLWCIIIPQGILLITLAIKVIAL